MTYLETVEQDIGLYQNDYIASIEENLSLLTGLYFHLGEPLSYSDNRQFPQMKSNEREFAKLLLSKGLLVFFEPKIEGIEQTPDFYIINQISYTGTQPYCGKFIELTLCKREDVESNSKYGARKFARKRRQMEVFRSLGIPIVYLYREEQENIRRLQQVTELF